MIPYNSVVSRNWSVRPQGLREDVMQLSTASLNVTPKFLAHQPTSHSLTKPLFAVLGYPLRLVT